MIGFFQLTFGHFSALFLCVTQVDQVVAVDGFMPGLPLNAGASPVLRCVKLLLARNVARLLTLPSAPQTVAALDWGDSIASVCNYH